MNRVLTYGGPVDVTDEELTAEALAADPDAPLADDAMPFECGDDAGGSNLPDWYMPAAGGPNERPRDGVGGTRRFARRRQRRRVLCDVRFPRIRLALTTDAIPSGERRAGTVRVWTATLRLETDRAGG